jgi:hypothetical protein
MNIGDSVIDLITGDEVAITRVVITGENDVVYYQVTSDILSGLRYPNELTPKYVRI